jgi:hypothetical protein
MGRPVARYLTEAWQYPKSLGAYRRGFKRGAVLGEPHSRFTRISVALGSGAIVLYMYYQEYYLKRVGKENY